MFCVLVLGSLQLYCNRRTVGWILVLPSSLAGFRYVLSVIETNLVHHKFKLAEIIQMQFAKQLKCNCLY